jgi:hypothetical protein
MSTFDTMSNDGMMKPPEKQIKVEVKVEEEFVS